MTDLLYVARWCLDNADWRATAAFLAALAGCSMVQP